VQLAQHSGRFGAHQAAQIVETQIHGPDIGPIGIRECKAPFYKILTMCPGACPRAVAFLR
jgi:hypothetical protein